MNLNQLYYFKTLAKYEHYTKASEALFISQPSLTHSIKELEKELNTLLFTREGRNVKLSQEGKIFLKYVTQALDILDSGVEEIKQFNENNKKTIEVGVISTVINNYFAPIVQNQMQKNKNITIHFRSDRTANIINSIKNHECDFGICSKTSDPNLVFLPLLHEEFVLITPKKHPLTKKDKVTIFDILDYPLITYRHDLPIYNNVMKILNKYEIEPNIYYELDDETSIASMVSLNFGIGIVANNDNLKPFNNIEIIHLDIKQNNRTIYLVYDPSVRLSSEAKKIIDELISHHAY